MSRSEAKRRCHFCREFYPECDLFPHKVHGLICKKCHDKIKK